MRAKAQEQRFFSRGKNMKFKEEFNQKKIQYLFSISGN